WNSVVYERKLPSLILRVGEFLSKLCSKVKAFAKGIPGNGVLVRVGDGDRLLARKLVEELAREVPEATIELVDESGTSVGGSKTHGMQRDEVAAARIAFRKGKVVSPGTRSRD
ncbi:MAG: hypothetical protein JRM95_03285, partial [Nitrososphaerota archaeon]|nr:hypothetical protein [Nitrososphaerota archaeon]